MITNTFNSKDDMQFHLIHDIIQQIYLVHDSKDTCNILITGGSSFQSNITLLLKNIVLDENKNIIFWLTDERILRKESEKRNDHFITDFIECLNPRISFETWKIYEAENELIYDYVSKFKDELDRKMKSQSFDISILTLGIDGHIGSNWPNLVSQLCLDSNFCTHLNLIDAFPNRIGFSLKRICNSDITFLYASGDAKIHILNQMISEDKKEYFKLTEIGQRIHMYLNSGAI
jgi:6-phosphogluconolactonase/glucosamine-6-phosphate isomerase/deaminase